MLSLAHSSGVPLLWEPLSPLDAAEVLSHAGWTWSPKVTALCLKVAPLPSWGIVPVVHRWSEGVAWTPWTPDMQRDK